ncbi:chemotaxis protein CheA [Rugamonas apoptosis]|uniref:Chemotaxis protein CheA n=1 Tax=Rugamonas apoptosis TaxID=2758570 RepID=A0A7W2F8B4_9BURK|nr:chemotaxis protein CheA [Rugamonas apoptosis]MBA5686980.1 chemotaxis protein CheA [Rugamonas apoptosis]
MSGLDARFDDALLLFYSEARDLLQQIEDALLWLEESPGDSEAINALFRAAHTIKGTAGVFNIGPVVSFTHQVESVLERVRQGQVPFDATLGALMLTCCDQIAALLADAEQGGSAAPPAEDLLARLAAYLEQQPPAPPAADPRIGTWHLSLRFRDDTFRNGFDPLSVIDYLATLGRVTILATIVERLPAWDAFDPESCFLGFELRLETEAMRADIEAAFEFLTDDCVVHILAPTRRAADFIALIEELDHEQRLGEILVGCGALSAEALAAALARQQQTTHPAPMLGEILVDQNHVAPEVLDAALKRQARAPVPQGRPDAGLFVRVAADKLDDLINLVGELVICGASATLQAQGSRNPDLIGTTAHLGRLVDEIRNGALALRMVRIGETFVRYRRVVHDISTELGKEVRLEIDGADTELDKSVVERIGDPLMHLVRNALDHGIEPAAQREARGKSAVGTITLAARHDSGSIVIEVGDDGRGLDGEVLLAKARERGQVAPGQVLSEAEKLELIFAPGFSTAAEVTNLSGRGVGMDVVRQNIEALRGSIKLSSVVGLGTRVEIRLPLTLAIIDGFLVKVGDGAFVIPLQAVTECLDANGTRLQGMAGAAGYIDLRGDVLAVLDLRAVFDVPGPAPSRRRIVVVRTGGGAMAGLMVDELLGEYQTVIKPLGKLFRQLRGISGSTVLGSGDVALILDVGVLVKMTAGQARDGWRPQIAGMGTGATSQEMSNG